MKRARWIMVLPAILAATLVATPAIAQPPPNYLVGNFDVYKYSTDGTPIPDVDKNNFPGHLGSNSCWQATAANILAAAGYGKPVIANPTAQQRADHIYTQLTNDLGVQNLGCCARGINYWMLTYGKNPASPEFMPENRYTDVTVRSDTQIPLLPYQAGNNPPGSYNWLLDELKRCQFVGVGLDDPKHCMTLVGGNYWNNPNGQQDGNKSIWHDSDGAPPGQVGPGGGDNPDTVTHPGMIGALVDDDVYTNAIRQGTANWWALADYWSKVPNQTGHADYYAILCPGLRKPQDAMENYDIAYYMQADPVDGDNVLNDPMFRIAGAMAGQVGGPQFVDDVTLLVENLFVPEWHKEVYLLVDYIDRVAGRQENITLLSDDGRTWNPAVTASADDGQLLFTWILDYQPGWEHINFPSNKYSLLDGDVKDWDLSTICVPEPATLALLTLGGVAALLRRRRQG